MRSFWLCERFYGKNLVLSTLPNCPECVAREKKALKKQYEMEAAKAEEEDKDYFIPSDRDIGSDIEIPMKLDPSTKHFVCKRCGLYATGNKYLTYVIGLTKENLQKKTNNMII